MSTTIHSPEVDLLAAYRKRSRDRQDDAVIMEKRPRRYYFRLESESSRGSEEDTESVYSIQDQETDIVRDTSDTESKSDSNEEYDVEIEYEVASLSDDDNSYQFSNSSTSGEEDIMLAAVEAICDRSLEAWVTDGEDSDTTSEEEHAVDRSDFSTCIQCKSQNDHPLYRYCEKCFQQSCRQCKKRKAYKCFPLCHFCYKDRKRFFPPRPRRARRPRKRTPPPLPVKLDTLRSCLKGLSQDSGIGSSQELDLNLDQIVVPTSWSSVDGELATASSSSLSSCDLGSESAPEPEKLSRKRSFDETTITSEPETKKRKQSEPDTSELCIFCNNAPKDSIFLHTNIGHRCCCYKCAKRTLQTTKRCPICNRAVNKVIRVYTS